MPGCAALSAHTYPCQQEDHWDEGDMHFQLWPCDGSDGTYCSGQQGMLIHAVNGNTMQPNQWGHSQVEYTYNWQANTWYYISAQYSSKDHTHKLYVNNALEQTIEDSGAVTPVTLDSARIGSWLNRDDQITRSLHGEISVFRIWNIITDGQDICPPAQTAGLIASYVFGHSGDTLLDLSGNSYDGLIHVSAAPFAKTRLLPKPQRCHTNRTRTGATSFRPASSASGKALAATSMVTKTTFRSRSCGVRTARRRRRSTLCLSICG